MVGIFNSIKCPYFTSLLTEHAAGGSQPQPGTHSEGQNLLNALAKFVASTGHHQPVDVQEAGINPGS